MRALLIGALLTAALAPAQELKSVYESEISGNTFRSRYFGFQMSFPDGWQAQHAGEYGPVSSLGKPLMPGWTLLLQARPLGTSSGDARQIRIGVAPRVEGSTHSLEDILRDRLNEIEGLPAPRLVEINSRAFARADFHSSRTIAAGDQAVELEEHTTVFLTAAHDHYVAFVFRSSNQEELKLLVKHAEGISGWSATKPAMAKPPLRIRVNQGVITGQAISKKRPKYPGDAKRKGIQGAVVLRAVINTEGHIKDLEAISGPLELREAAMDAVRTWRYRPYKLDGKPVEVETQITINFTLGG